jgi:hypothetical protein
MKRLLPVLALIVWSSQSSADPVLIGQWISDREASAAFNETHARLEARTALMIKEFMGRLVVTFGEAEVSYDLPNFVANIDGKTFPVTGLSETHPYAVVATTRSSIAIRTIEPVSHQPVIVVYNFVSDDRAWIYVRSTQAHIREYYRRVTEK